MGGRLVGRRMKPQKYTSALRSLFLVVPCLVAVGDLAGAQIRGTVESDELSGTPFADCIQGFAGDDSIYGGAGDDTIQGGDGNDYIDGGYLEVGDDVIHGGNGDDTIDASDGDDRVYGGAGDDQIFEFYSTYGDDLIDAGTGADSVEANNGDDTVLLGADRDADSLYVEFGEDRYVVVKQLYAEDSLTVGTWGGAATFTAISNGTRLTVAGQTGEILLIGLTPAQAQARTWVF